MKHTTTTLQIYRYALTRDMFRQHELMDFLNVSQPTASKHLKRAVATGAILVHEVSEGGPQPTKYYRANPQHVVEQTEVSPVTATYPKLGLNGSEYRGEPFPFTAIFRTIHTTDVPYNKAIAGISPAGKIRSMAGHALVDVVADALINGQRPDWIDLLEQVEEIKNLISRMRINGSFDPNDAEVKQFVEEAGRYA